MEIQGCIELLQLHLHLNEYWFILDIRLNVNHRDPFKASVMNELQNNLVTNP